MPSILVIYYLVSDLLPIQHELMCKDSNIHHILYLGASHKHAKLTRAKEYTPRSDEHESPYPAHLEGGVPGEVLRIKKEPYTQPATKQSYPMRGKGRDIGRGNEGRGRDDG